MFVVAFVASILWLKICSQVISKYYVQVVRKIPYHQCSRSVRNTNICEVAEKIIEQVQMTQHKQTTLGIVYST